MGGSSVGLATTEGRSPCFADMTEIVCLESPDQLYLYMRLITNTAHHVNTLVQELARTKKMLRQVVEEIGTAATRRREPQGFSPAPASFTLKLRPFTSVSLRVVFPPAGG